MIKILCINTKETFDFFKKRGLVIDVIYDTCSKIFPTVKTSTAITPDGKTVQLYSPDVRQYLETYKEKYDVILLGWNPNDYGQEFQYSGGQTFKTPLSNGSRFATIRIGTPNAEIHESMHIIGDILYTDLKKYDAVDQMDSTWIDGKIHFYYKNDFPEDPDSNFGRTWETYKKYLPELNSLGKMPTYKYFKDKEIVGLKPELVTLLDKARGIAGVPFVISSGLRTADHNAQVGGVQDSAHLTGEAVDIHCGDSVSRLKMIQAFVQVGFTRMGIGSDFIHVDISKTLPQNVCWTYYK